MARLYGAIKSWDLKLHWLFKEEPANYSIDDLIKDGKTSWSGVRNNLALKYLRTVKKGDEIFYYHSGDERQIVGIMRALGDAYTLDRKDIASSKEISVDVAPVEKFARPVSLESIKKDKAFKDFLLVKISRLSVMPVSEEQWKRLVFLSKN